MWMCCEIDDVFIVCYLMCCEIDMCIQKSVKQVQQDQKSEEHQAPEILGEEQKPVKQLQLGVMATGISPSRNQH
jgi:hypothetical protein